jgi:hypothetical protein
MTSVGIIMAMPNGFQNIHHALSLNNQNTIFKFSILLYARGI